MSENENSTPNPTPGSADWYDAQIAAQEALAQQLMNAFTATTLYQEYIRQTGVVAGLKQMKATLFPVPEQ